MTTPSHGDKPPYLIADNPPPGPCCAVCKQPARHNVPRLGPDGGWIHADGTHLCPLPAPPIPPITPTCTPAGAKEPRLLGGPVERFEPPAPACDIPQYAEAVEICRAIADDNNDPAAPIIHVAKAHIARALAARDARIAALERELAESKRERTELARAVVNACFEMGALKAERDQLAGVIAEIAKQKTVIELADDDVEQPDFETAYDICVKSARAAQAELAKAKAP